MARQGAQRSLSRWSPLLREAWPQGEENKRVLTRRERGVRGGVIGKGMVKYVLGRGKWRGRVGDGGEGVPDGSGPPRRLQWAGKSRFLCLGEQVEWVPHRGAVLPLRL